ncbi:MAG: uroporphyrinogen decarboxylase [Parvularculaceae bacterium]
MIAKGRKRRNSKFLGALAGEAFSAPPVWFMRQAGRYLPEYRETRAKAGSFLKLCFNPDLAAEVTLQPIRRFDLDAAILFSDILVIPKALGQTVTFVDGEGPRLSPPPTAKDLESFAKRSARDELSPIFETVRRTRAALAPEKALLGFAGAPWTVATYMLSGGPSDDPASLRSICYRDTAFIEALIDVLVRATVDYLIAQVEAGADALQLFDTWAGGLPESLARKLSLEPLRRIAEAVKRAHPDVPIILFPRGVGALAPRYAALPCCDALSIDTSTPWPWARAEIAPHATVQGGFDPLLVVAGGEAMEREARRLLSAFKGVPYVFNLGHGFTPQTPPENVARLVAIVREEA